MNWHPINEPILVSGGQDHRINLYDIRNGKGCLTEQIPQREPVRDVKFNPLSPDYFIAACDKTLDYYDMRKLDQTVMSRQNSHNNCIICLDWNKKYQNVLVSSSIDKEIKVWSITNNHEIEERVKLHHIDGSSHIYFHNKNPHLISVSSLNRDNSVTIYDIKQPFRPQRVIKGHMDIINSFVYLKDEDVIITGSKDNLLGMLQVDEFKKVYDTCPKFPVAFNQFDDLVYKLENPDLGEGKKHSLQNFDYLESNMFYLNEVSVGHTSINTPNQKKNVNSIASLTGGGISGLKQKSADRVKTVQRSTPPISPALSTPAQGQSLKNQHDFYFNLNKQVWNSRPITIIENIQMDNEMKSNRKMSLKDEITFMQLNYCRQKQNCFEYNSNVVKQLKKDNLSYYWIALQKLYNDYQNLAKEQGSQSNTHKHQRQASETSQDSFDFSATSPNNINKGSKQSNSQPLDLMKLYKYFEKYPMAFKQEIDEKYIYILENKKLRIKTERIKYYKQLLANQFTLSSLVDKESMMTVLHNSILDLIQHVIDDNELATGYWMFLAVKSQVQINESIIQKWTLSYVDLLKLLSLYTFTVDVVQQSPNDEIRRSNLTQYEVICTCPVQTDKDKKPCLDCNNLICSICQQTIKNSVIWCQGCEHSGHPQEYFKWFKFHEECPTGCGHKCFSK